MKKNLFAIFLVYFSLHSFAWGPDGHSIVAQLTMQFLSPEAKKNIDSYLHHMPADSVGNWMDMMRSNSSYDFMKPWHYIDYPAEESYKPSTNENILNRVIISYNELRHKNVLCEEQTRFDLLVLFHLMGDLSMPLHTGYDYDMGGNKAVVQYDTIKTNLHKFWDEDLLRLNHIDYQTCLTYYNAHSVELKDTINGIHPALWMQEARTLLPIVYKYDGYKIEPTYVAAAQPIILRQLIISSLRLSAMLNSLFTSSAAPTLDKAAIKIKYPNSIEVENVANFIGKSVTTCGRVYGIKTTDNVTFINVGAAYPNSPLTLVIFKKSYEKFPFKIDEYYSDKNICLKGELLEYKGKAEIIVENPGDILIQ